MPIADNRPPIVVGMRQTSKAISTVTERTVPEPLLRVAPLPSLGQMAPKM